MLKIVFTNADHVVLFVADSVEAISEKYTTIKSYPNLMPIIVDSNDEIVIGSVFKHVPYTELNGFITFVHTPTE